MKIPLKQKIDKAIQDCDKELAQLYKSLSYASKTRNIGYGPMSKPHISVNVEENKKDELYILCRIEALETTKRVLESLQRNEIPFIYQEFSSQGLCNTPVSPKRKTKRKKQKFYV